MPVTDDLETHLRRHVDVLSRDIGERHVWRPEALDAAAAYIEETFRGFGYEPTRQCFEAQGVACSNLAAEVPGSDLGRPVLLVGAHYDTVIGSPGADDNASGVAVLLEIAHLLRSSTGRSGVRCVAFANEEAPFFGSQQMGSRRYAQSARARGDRIGMMLSLEMLGFYSTRPHSQRYPPLLRHFYPDRGNFVAFVANLRSSPALLRLWRAFRALSDFPCERLVSPACVPGVALSDHLSFWQAGYPAVMVTDTAFYRYLHYHLRSDTPDRLDFAALSRVTTGITRALAALAA